MKKNLHILVVDDEKEVCRTLYHGLGSKPYKVLTATTGNEALAKVKKHSPDLIILDMNLPDMDGQEVLRSIKEINPEIPIVALSDDRSRRLRKEAVDLGAYDFLLKPFTLSEIWRVVQEALGGGDHSAKPTEKDNVGG